MQNNVSGRTKNIFEKGLVIDMLEATIPEMRAEYFDTLLNAGINTLHITVPYMTDDLPASIEKMAKFHKLMDYVDKAKIIQTAEDILNAKKEGKVGVIIGMQDSIPFERNLDLIRIFKMLGVSVMQIAYTRQNYLGAGCGATVDNGLTETGEMAVKELNRLGVLIDVSHCGNTTAFEVAKLSKKPIAITHATPSALVKIPRGKSDETLKAVASKGGVIGQVVLAPFCEMDNRIGTRPSLKDYIEIIDYLVKLVGVKHVGIGTDVEPFWTREDYDSYWKIFRKALIYPREVPPYEKRYVEGFIDILDIWKIADELFKKGYSEDDVKAIMGGNWFRLLKEVWG